jgi:hypothetical protein
MPTIKVPEHIKQQIGLGIIATSGSTVGENLDSLCSQFPQLAKLLYDDDGGLAPQITIIVNEHDVTRHEGLSRPSHPHDDMRIEIKYG